jgi:hypothetical protein
VGGENGLLGLGDIGHDWVMGDVGRGWVVSMDEEAIEKLQQDV